ncbi:MAG TPA: ATP-binding protein [Polyangia bacterium]|nr:ATP-binding protein [Polyangia bacterium]
MSEYGQQAAGRVLDELPFGIWVGRAPGGEVLYTNRAFREILGSQPPADTHLGDLPDAYGIHDRQGRPVAPEDLAVSRAIATGMPVIRDDLVIHRPDGERIYVRVFANPIRDASGAIAHVVLAVTDVTAEVRALVERAEIEKHMAVAIHHAPVLFFIMDADGVLTVADGALREPLERGRPQMVGRSLLEAYKDHPTVPGFIRRGLAGETVSYSVDVRGMILDVWLGPMRDAVGTLVGAIGVCTDVTETRRLQSRIIQGDRIHAMGTVAASVAHEINNPLTYVLGGLTEAEHGLDNLGRELEQLVGAGAGAEAVAAAARTGLERLREILGPALGGTKRIREVTRELSTFTRPDDEALVPLDVASVVRSVLKLVRKEIEARAQLIEEIGPSPHVLANEPRLVQVLVNLLMNAWQALPAPDPTSHAIGVRTSTGAGEAVIEIWDSGPGVPAPLRERIFEPFVTTKDVGTGTGLGLFVCRNIVDSFKGRITVDDAPGGGALFRVCLPAAPSPARVAPAATAAAVPRAGGRRARILLVDDDAAVGRALAKQLAASYEVRAVIDGREGLEAVLADAAIDLVYCDLMMQGCTGLEVEAELRRRAPECLSKLVFMTGGAFTREARAFLDAHPGAWVEKPFDIVADARRRLG